jgi:hypothetical protein
LPGNFQLFLEIIYSVVYFNLAEHEKVKLLIEDYVKPKA